MPDIVQLLALVDWNRVMGLAALPLTLQFVAALIHPAVFKAVSWITVLGIIVMGVLDGMSLGNTGAFQAQIVEMLCVVLVVLIGHGLIKRVFTAMARASHAG